MKVLCRPQIRFISVSTPSPCELVWVDIEKRKTDEKPREQTW